MKVGRRIMIAGVSAMVVAGGGTAAAATVMSRSPVDGSGRRLRPERADGHRRQCHRKVDPRVRRRHDAKRHTERLGGRARRNRDRRDIDSNYVLNAYVYCAPTS